MTPREVLSWASRYLAEAGLETPRLDAEVLLASLLGQDRTWIHAHSLAPVLGDEAVSAFRELVARRANHEPVAYILGEREFWSLSFRVTRDTLVPRPETEILVEEVLRVCRAEGWRSPRILDAGTGSGVIAVTLAVELPDARILALDCSHAALRIARENAEIHGVGERIRFVQSDWLSAIRKGLDGHEAFDCVASNPPYLAEGTEACRLEPDVREYEPACALFGGREGMDAILALLRQAPDVLRPGGLLCMEIGWDQAEMAKKAAGDEGVYEDLRVIRDLAGMDRVFALRLRDGAASRDA